MLHCEDIECQIDLLVVNRQSVMNASTPSLQIPDETLICNGRKVRGLIEPDSRHTIVRSGVLDNSTGTLKKWKSRLTDYNGQTVPIIGTQNIVLPIKKGLKTQTSIEQNVVYSD